MAIFTTDDSPHILIATAPRTEEAKWSDWQDRLTLGKSIRRRLPKIWEATFGMQEATKGAYPKGIPADAIGANGFAYRDRFVIPEMGVDLDGIEVLGAIMCANRRARGFRLLLFASPETYTYWGRDFAIGMIELPLPDEWDRPDTYFLSSKDKDIAAQLVDYSFGKASYSERSEQMHDLVRLYDLRFADKPEDLESIGTDPSGRRHILMGGATGKDRRTDVLTSKEMDEQKARNADEPEEEGNRETSAAGSDPRADDVATLEPADDGEDFEDYLPEGKKTPSAGLDEAKREYGTTTSWDEEFEDYESPSPAARESRETQANQSLPDEGLPLPHGNEEGDPFHASDEEADADEFEDYDSQDAPDEEFEDYTPPEVEVAPDGKFEDYATPEAADIPDEDGEFGDWNEIASGESRATKPDQPAPAYGPTQGHREDPVPADGESARGQTGDTDEPRVRIPEDSDGSPRPSPEAEMNPVPRETQGRIPEAVGGVADSGEDDIIEYIGEWEEEPDAVFSPKHPATNEQVDGESEAAPVHTETEAAESATTVPPTAESSADAEWLQAVRNHMAALGRASDAHVSAFGRSLHGQALIPASVLPTQAKATAAMAETLRRMGAPAMTDEQVLAVLAMVRGEGACLPEGQSRDMPVMVAALASAIVGNPVAVIVPDDERAIGDAKMAGAVMYRCAGFRVGRVTEGDDDETRFLACRFPVVYGTARAFGEGWLRDNMSQKPGRLAYAPPLVLASDLEGTLLGAIGSTLHSRGGDGKHELYSSIDACGWLLAANRIGGTLRAGTPYAGELREEYGIAVRESPGTHAPAADLPSLPSGDAHAKRRVAAIRWSEARDSRCRQAYGTRRQVAALSDFPGASAFLRSVIDDEARHTASGFAREGGDGNARKALMRYADLGGMQDAVIFRRAVLEQREGDTYDAMCGMLSVDCNMAFEATGGEREFAALVRTAALDAIDGAWSAYSFRLGQREADVTDADALSAYRAKAARLYDEMLATVRCSTLSGVLRQANGGRSQ